MRCFRKATSRSALSESNGRDLSTQSRCNNNPKTTPAPEAAGFKAAPIGGVSLGRAAGKATASQHATDLIRCCNVFPSIITIRIGEAGRCHILPPQRRTPFPNLPCHIEATIGRAPERKQPNCAGIIKPECLSIHPIVVPSTTQGCTKAFEAAFWSPRAARSHSGSDGKRTTISCVMRPALRQASVSQAQ